MSRNEKIQKLANAIKEFKGARHGDTWIRTPKPSARDRILHWIKELDLEEWPTIASINSFSTIEQFNRWISTL